MNQYGMQMTQFRGMPQWNAPSVLTEPPREGWKVAPASQYPSARKLVSFAVEQEPVRSVILVRDSVWLAWATWDYEDTSLLGLFADETLAKKAIADFKAAPNSHYADATNGDIYDRFWVTEDHVVG